MSASFAKLKIKGYPKFVDGTVSGSSVASYELQLNPTELDISFDLNSIIDNDEEPASAAGVPVGDKNKVYNKQSISFNFFIDSTGAIPNTPQGLGFFSMGSSIKPSLDTLRKATIKPTKDSHQPPFVELEWGTIYLIGKISSLSITLLRFNSSGDPIRAKVSLTLVEEVDEKVISREFQSPDITRIPTIKEGDSLVSLCHDFYDDPKYFIRIAEFNNLPTFRKLEVGSMLQFPPLEK